MNFLIGLLGLSRHNGTMTARDTPQRGTLGEDPIYALGNLVRVKIIGYLRRSGPRRRGEIAQALDIGNATISAALIILVDEGLVVTDPVNPTAGQHVRYSVHEPTVTEMWVTLSQAIGEL